MKKILVSILSVLMVLALAAPVSAEGELIKDVYSSGNPNMNNFGWVGFTTVKDIDLSKDSADIVIYYEYYYETEGVISKVHSGDQVSVKNKLWGAFTKEDDNTKYGTDEQIAAGSFVQTNYGPSTAQNLDVYTLITDTDEVVKMRAVVTVTDGEGNEQTAYSNWVSYSSKGAIVSPSGINKNKYDEVVSDGLDSLDHEKVEAVASVNDVGYTSLEKAIENANGSTVTLENDVKLEKPLLINEDVSIDLNGKSVTASSTFTSDPSLGNGKDNLINLDDADVTINGGSIVGTNSTKNLISVTAGSKLNISAVKLDHTNSIGGAPIIANNSTVTLNDTNDFILGDESWYAINVDPKGGNSQLNVNGTVNVTDNSSTKNKAIVYVEGVSGNNAKVNLNATFTNSGNGPVVATDNTATIRDVVTINGGNVVINGDDTVTIKPTPTPEKPSRPTYRPSSPSKDLPSNTKECQKEFGDEYIWSDEYDACVIKFMIVDTATK